MGKKYEMSSEKFFSFPKIFNLVAYVFVFFSMQIGVNLRVILFLKKLSSPHQLGLTVDLQLNVNVPFSTKTVCLEQSYIIGLFSSLFVCLFGVF